MTQTADRDPPDLSVVFSFRNEEAVLAELLRRTRAVLDADGVDYELVFVNDDSSDGSLELLADEHSRDPRIKIVNTSRRFGVFECAMAGMSVSTGRSVVLMDADLQDPPELIPRLLEKWRAGAEVVHTVRSRRRGDGWLKRMVTACGYAVIDYFSDTSLPVNAGDFKLLSRNVVDSILELPESNPYIRGLVCWVGYRQATQEYERDERHAGASHFPMFSSLNPLRWFIYAVSSFSFWPLYAISIVGTIGALGAGIAAALGIVAGLTGNGYPGQTVIVLIAMSFFWGTGLMALGTVGLYVSRIYKDVRGRPRYIIKNVVGIDGHARDDGRAA